MARGDIGGANARRGGYHDLCLCDQRCQGATAAAEAGNARAGAYSAGENGITRNKKDAKVAVSRCVLRAVDGIVGGVCTYVYPVWLPAVV